MRMSRWMNRPGWGGPQMRVCDTGPQVSLFSLFRCGPQWHGAIRINCGANVPRQAFLAILVASPEYGTETLTPGIHSNQSH